MYSSSPCRLEPPCSTTRARRLGTVPAGRFETSRQVLDHRSTSKNNHSRSPLELPSITGNATATPLCLLQSSLVADRSNVGMKSTSTRSAVNAGDMDDELRAVSKPKLDWNERLSDGDSGDQRFSTSSPWMAADRRVSRRSDRLESASPSLSRQSQAAETQPTVKSARWSWTESVDGSGLAELCQYVQQLEADKAELERKVHVLREQEASHTREQQNNTRRIALLEASLADAMRASDAFRQEKDIVVGLQASERERMAALVALLEDAQRRHEEAERARQLAVFKLSALQTSIATASSDKLVASVAAAELTLVGAGARFENDTISERIEQYKREMELLRQKLALADERATEQQKLAVAAALRDAELERNAAIERVRLDCETRLSEWRHDEALRAKETQAALEEDRYSVRLELKHAIQRAEIDQHVARLQSDNGCLCNLVTGSSSAPSTLSTGMYQRRVGGSSVLATQLESDFSIGTLDEVLVRMQLELLRTRRFEALKKVLLIRRSKLTRVAQMLFRHWKRIAEAVLAKRRQAAMMMLRVSGRMQMRATRVAFGEWREATCEARALAFQARALSCWNRMLATERLCHVVRVVEMRRRAASFHRWRLATSSTESMTAASPSPDRASSPSGGGGSGASATDDASMQSLQHEIKKLHEQLASSKSEAWRYKRQLLKQFL